MIAGFLAITLQAVAMPSPGEEAQKVMLQANRYYRDCVIRAAGKMEASDEQATLIADTAVLSCRGARALSKAFSLDWVAKKFPSLDQSAVDVAVEKSMVELDAGYKADALAAVLTQRALRK